MKSAWQREIKHSIELADMAETEKKTQMNVNNDIVFNALLAYAWPRNFGGLPLKFLGHPYGYFSYPQCHSLSCKLALFITQRLKAQWPNDLLN